MRGLKTTAFVSMLSTLSLLTLAPREAGAAPGDHPYAATGPKAVKVVALSATADLVVPTTAADGPFPLIVASHGWSASGTNQVGWAKHFASYGFAVAVPSFPSPLSPDTQVNANIIVGLVNDLRKPPAATTHNILQTGKVGLEGHSAGGLATTVAADKLGAATVGGVVLFDPVDRDAVGQAAYAKLCSPLITLFAAPSSCNNQAGWRGFASTTTADAIGFDVVGSTHCDGENDPRGLCGFACGGGADVDRQKVYANYATAFLLGRLKNDAAAMATLTTANIAGDTKTTKPLRVDASPACGGTTNPGADGGASSGGSTSGGTSSGNAASSSSSGESSSGSNAAPSASSGDGDPSASGNDGGCSLHAAPSAKETFAGALALSAVVSLFRQLRRRRSARSSG